MKYVIKNLPFLFFVCCSLNINAQVKYDEGAMYISGVTLLQDRANEKDYYYLPQFPRLSTKDDGSFEFLCLKYVGDKAENSGGLFHALVTFDIPDTLLERLTKELQKKVPGARIAGPVPLMQPKKDDPENVTPSFDIVSAVLSNKDGKDAMTRSIVTSGFAPLTPGSKAAVASLLNQNGATLLWNSFTGPNSDVSVSIHGYYEAAVKAYNAVVTAEMNVVYNHFSQMIAKQEGYNKKQIREVVDDLSKKGGIKVDVFDRSAGLGIKTSEMDGILNLVTNKLTEIMFDTKTGWSKEPETVDPNLGFDPRGRQGDKTKEGQIISDVGDAMCDVMGSLPILGWFVPKKKKNTNPEYITDNQYVLKDIQNIRTNKFYLNLSKATTIKVPFHTAGNLGGLYSALGEDTKYFRIVNMDDPDFQKRSISFQVDGKFFDAFDEIINFATVNFRKKYSNGQDDVTSQVIINGEDLKKGVSFKDVMYPRLGLSTSEWLNYEYQILWSFKGKQDVVRYPSDAKEWIKSSDPAVSLTPPLVKEFIELDGDREQFRTDSISSVNVNFASVLGGQKTVLRVLY
ncbi:MAG: hypothetical protein IPM85_15635 [Chitinophagaceae bacterium]|nr:hypothetical protein [Chitinophagaceae bacterium]